MKKRVLGKALIRVEIKVFKREHALNLLINKGIDIFNITREDIITLSFDMYYSDYKKVKSLIKSIGGKIKIKSKGKGLEFFIEAKKSIALFLGVGVFALILFAMSNFVWRINIESKNYLPPYDIRAFLTSQGVHPGIRKSNIDVYKLEKELEKELEGVMWSKIRIEGSTLMVKFEEKKISNTKEVDENKLGTNTVATMDAVVKRVYTSSGTSVVKEGDIVNKGDILIKGKQSIAREGAATEGEKEKDVIPEGVVIADTLYEKIVDINISGDEISYTGEKSNDIYLNCFGKKFYLKKTRKDFQSYDKIEKKGKFINKTVYYEKEIKKINDTEEVIINDAISKLQAAVEKEISRQAIIIDKTISKEYIEDGKVRLKVVFTVEQDIASL